MGQLNYVEQTGHGVPLIVSKYGKKAFMITDNFIVVTIPFNKIIEKDITLTKKEKDIINCIEKNSKITIQELSHLTNSSKTSVYKIIKHLKEIKAIYIEGSDKMVFG